MEKWCTIAGRFPAKFLGVAMLFLLCSWVNPTAASTDEYRVAVIVANYNYTSPWDRLFGTDPPPGQPCDSHVRTDLTFLGTAHDQTCVATVLKGAGFEIKSGRAANRADFLTWLGTIQREIADKRSAGKRIVLYFWYSGHGMLAPNKEPVLVPEDSKVRPIKNSLGELDQNATTNLINSKGVRLQEIVDKLTSPDQSEVAILVWNACLNPDDTKTARDRLLQPIMKNDVNGIMFATNSGFRAPAVNFLSSAWVTSIRSFGSLGPDSVQLKASSSAYNAWMNARKANGLLPVALVPQNIIPAPYQLSDFRFNTNGSNAASQHPGQASQKVFRSLASDESPATELASSRSIQRDKDALEMVELLNKYYLHWSSGRVYEGFSEVLWPEYFAFDLTRTVRSQSCKSEQSRVIASVRSARGSDGTGSCWSRRQMLGDKAFYAYKYQGVQQADVEGTRKRLLSISYAAPVFEFLNSERALVKVTQYYLSPCYISEGEKTFALEKRNGRYGILFEDFVPVTTSNRISTRLDDEIDCSLELNDLVPDWRRGTFRE